MPLSAPELYQKNEKDYEGSPAPLLLFLGIGIISSLWGTLLFPSLESIWFLTTGIFFLFISPATVAINKEWEEAIILRFGRYQRLVGPGLFFRWPGAENFLKQDTRITTIDVKPQEVLTKDNISVNIDAVVFMRIVNTRDSLINIQSVRQSVIDYAQTTMKDVIGNVELDDLLARRDEIADQIELIVDKDTKSWGVDIIAVKLQNIALPEDMKRVIARQAEAEREKRAIIIKSEGEKTAAAFLEEAVKMMSPQALYLRTLSSLEDISYDQSNTIVFALPLDVTKGEIVGFTALAKKRDEKGTSSK